MKTKKKAVLLAGLIAGLGGILLLGLGALVFCLFNPPGGVDDMNDFYNLNGGTLGRDYLLENGFTDEAGLKTLRDVWLVDEPLEEEDCSRICTPDGEAVQLRVNRSDYYFTVTYPLPEGDVTLVFRDGSGSDCTVIGILPDE